MKPVFVFDDPPSLLEVYESIEEARESVESLDVTAEQQLAFTAAGQVIEVAPALDRGLWAHLELTDRYDLTRLKSLLREAHGPAHLADDPIAYAEEWWHLDDIRSRLPPLLPSAAHNWWVRRRSGR